MGHHISAHKVGKVVADYYRNGSSNQDIYKFLDAEEHNVAGINGTGAELYPESYIKEALEKAKAAASGHEDTVEFLEAALSNVNEDGDILITFD